jgi:ubiquinone/menaquinone biosynthesis C-methylase UbiE
MLRFDESAARALERTYQTPDVVAQRAHVIQSLELRPGEHALDVGCGPGLLLRDAAACVGARGAAVGVDASEPMLALARARCADQPQVELHRADAQALPFADARFDVAVSTQVFEYLFDVDAALRELHRVLRPGGRALILDTDWDSLVVHASDRARHRRVMRAWEAHLADPHLPATLAPRLRRAGFQVTRREVFPIVNTEHHAHTYSAGILLAIRAFVAGRDGVSAEEAEAWHTDLRELGDRGEYLFAISRFLFHAVKPAPRPDA